MERETKTDMMKEGIGIVREGGRKETGKMKKHKVEGGEGIESGNLRISGTSGMMGYRPDDRAEESK